MIQEISWYLKENRFSGIVTEIDGALTDYARAKGSGASEAELTALREKARAICERHSVDSGMRDDTASFINVDAEFFSGQSLDAETLDQFEKNIVKAYCYQRVLWTYMGTTGTFTQITKAEMQRTGLKYENYLPASYKKEHPPKKPLEGKLGENTVPIYMYGDGTISADYHEDKAKIQFDALKDGSGFSWTKGYDPNDSVKKDGWFGAFDETGTWTKVIDTKNETEQGSREAVRIEPLRIIKDGDTAILHDPAGMLLNPPEIAYVTGTGELYGALDADTDATVEAIGDAMKHMGVKKIDAVSGRNDGAQTTEAYRRILGALAAKDLALRDAASMQKKIDADLAADRAKREEGKAINIERTINAARKTGTKGDNLALAIATGSATVPLSPRNRKDATALGLSASEAAHIASLDVGAEFAREFDASLANIYASWSLYEKGGFTKTEIADKVYAQILKNRKGDETITASATFASIATTAIPFQFADEKTVDFADATERESYLERLEKKRALPKGGKEATETAISALPAESNADQQAMNNRSLTRVLGSYKEIAASTGMTLAEAIAEAVKAAGGKTAPVATHAPIRAAMPAQNRQIHFELPLAKAIADASRENRQTRTVPTADLVAHTSGKEADTLLVVGGSGGNANLASLGFDRATLAGTFRMSESDAAKSEEFLADIGLADGASPTALATLTELVTSAAKSEGGKKGTPQTAASFRKNLLGELDARDDVTYNLASDKGRAQYAQSGRFKATGLSKETLAELVAAELLSATAIQPATNKKNPSGVHSVEPVYRSRPGIPSITKTEAKGVPEKVVQMPIPVVATNVAKITTAPATIAPVDTVPIKEANAVLRGSFTHSAGTDANAIPALIFGGSGTADGETMPMTSLAEVAGLTETRLIKKYGYSPTEAAKAHAFLGDIAVPLTKTEYAKSTLVPDVTEMIQTGKTAKTLRSHLVDSLSNRDDVAFNLTSPRGRSAWTSTSQYKSSNLDDKKLASRIAKAQKLAGSGAAVYAMKAPKETQKGSTSSSVPVSIQPTDTVFLGSAQTKLRNGIVPGGSDRTSDLPALIFGGESASDAAPSVTASTLATLGGLSAPQLVRRYGYTPAEAEKTEKLLRDITIPEGKTGYVASEIIPELNKALSGTNSAKGLQQRLVESLGGRSDIAYNLTTPRGRNAYTATPQFKASGMNDGDLTRYIDRIANTGSTNANVPSPVYATSLASSMAAQRFARGHMSGSIPMNAQANTTTSVTHSAPASTAAMNTAMNTVQSAPRSMTASTKAQNTVHEARTVTPTTTPSPVRTQAQRTEDPELARLRRIEANYDKDKAMLAKEKAPALARSESHDVGHAEGTDAGMESDRSAIKRMSAKFTNQIKTELTEDL